jgi:endo-1,4-beta-xylanase
MKKTFYTCFLASLFLSASAQEKGLKDHYAKFFPMGAAVTPQNLRGPDSLLLATHFNSITAENAMKMGPIHPREHQYNWAPADAIVQFAMDHKMKMRGHTLCWHTQAPAWLFRDSATGQQVTKAILLQRLKDHITEVVTRYKGKIYAWDVVNEVIADDTAFYRKSLWYQICGEEFITRAFEYAHAADPKALLFYNDYDTENPEKREKIYTMLKKMLAAKVPIHGVGLQGHWNIYDSLAKELPASIEKFSSLGLKVQVTELDISVYKGESGRRQKRSDETDTFTPEQEQKQVEQYKIVFDVFRKYRSKLTGITFWNVSDRRSWLDNFPVAGRKNYPLLFDRENKPKRAYFEVVKFDPDPSPNKRGF